MPENVPKLNAHTVIQRTYSGQIKSMCGSGYTLKKIRVGRYRILFFFLTFFLEYSDLLGNVDKADIKLSIFEDMNFFSLFTSNTKD